MARVRVNPNHGKAGDCLIRIRFSLLVKMQVAAAKIGPSVEERSF